MFGKVKYFSMFYCLCYAKYRNKSLSVEQVTEERDPDLNEEEDVILDAIREEH